VSRIIARGSQRPGRSPTRCGRQLRPNKLQSLVEEIVGSRNGPFGAADLKAIREKTAAILQGVLT
jgi:hypothetical protein